MPDRETDRRRHPFFIGVWGFRGVSLAEMAQCARTKWYRGWSASSNPNEISVCSSGCFPYQLKCNQTEAHKIIWAGRKKQKQQKTHELLMHKCCVSHGTRGVGLGLGTQIKEFHASSASSATAFDSCKGHNDRADTEWVDWLWCVPWERIDPRRAALCDANPYPSSVRDRP